MCKLIDEFSKFNTLPFYLHKNFYTLKKSNSSPTCRSRRLLAIFLLKNVPLNIKVYWYIFSFMISQVFYFLFLKILFFQINQFWFFNLILGINNKIYQLFNSFSTNWFLLSIYKYNWYCLNILFLRFFKEYCTVNHCYCNILIVCWNKI